MKQTQLPDKSLLSYVDQGSGPTIIFIHAPCIGHVNFIYQEPLTQEFRVIIPDLPGHGSSTPAKGTLTIDSLVRTLHQFIEQLELEHITLCGYSNGASIVLEYLLQFPDRVTSAILVSGYSEVNSLYLHTRYLLAETLASLGAVGVLARSITSSHLKDERLQASWIHQAEKTDAHSLYQYYLAGHHYNCTSRLPEIHAPVLLIYGEQDEAMHPYGKLLHQFLKNSQLHFIPSVSHQVITKACDSFHQLLVPFVREHASQAEKSPLTVW